MKTINVNTLEKAFIRIIEKLKNEDIKEIELLYDLYRIIPTGKWQISQSENKIEHTGSLQDDLDEIEKLIADKSRPCTYVDFDRVASILRYVSETQNPVE